MTDLLSIGASGVRAYQGALTTVGDNIANTGVAGYSRRSIRLNEVTSVNGIGGRLTSGNGVVVTGVSRATDGFRSAAVRNAGADLARTEAGSVWLDRIQSALTGSALGDRLTGFFGTAQSLAADPTSVPQRAVMVETARTLAQSFTTTGKQLDGAVNELDAAATQAAASLDSFAAALAKVNDGIARAPSGSATAAQLGDQRDQLLEQMSAVADLDVRTDEIGRATVRLGGAAGPVLVAGTEAGHVSYHRAGGAVSFGVSRAGTLDSFHPTGGALAGMAEGAGRLYDTRASLNALATDFVNEVNRIQASGRDLDGQPGAALFAVGATPTDVSVTLADPRGIAAAKAGGGTRDASNLELLQSMRGARGWETGTTALVGGNAAALEQRKLVADAQSAIRDGAVSARDGLSAVDLDQEAVELLRFQQAYQASSRVIQVARETMQTLLDIR